jgi:hypothetical protein
MAIDLLGSLEAGAYVTSEGTPSADNQSVINYYQQSIVNSTDPTKSWGADKKNTVISLLTQIESYISQNRANTQLQSQQLTQSENILNQQINDLNNSDTTLSSLMAQNIDQGVQNISNAEYAEYYSQITELNYRLSCIQQRKTEVKTELIDYDNDMVTVQNYIQAISTTL